MQKFCVQVTYFQDIESFQKRIILKQKLQKALNWQNIYLVQKNILEGDQITHGEDCGLRLFGFQCFAYAFLWALIF